MKQAGLIGNTSPNLEQNSGFSVVEVIVAMALVMLIVPALAAAILYLHSLIIDAGLQRQAVTLTRQGLEEAKAGLRKGSSTIKSLTKNDSTFQTTVTIEPVHAAAWQLTSTTTWLSSRKIAQQTTLTTLITDALTASYTQFCPLQQVEWNHGSVFASLDFADQLILTSIAVRNGYAYLTINSAAESASDLFIVDISDPAHPTPISSLHTGPGLSTITVIGTLAYVGNTSINGQLQIIDVANPRSPFLKHTYKLPGNYTDNTTVTQSLTYDKGLVYLGTQKSEIAEVHIIDVRNLSEIKELGSWELDTRVNAIVVKGDYAYIASPANEELKVLNITDPGNLRQVGGFDAPQVQGNGKSLSLTHDLLFMGRTVGNSELYTIGIAAAPQLDIINQANVDSSINSIASTAKHLFLGTIDANQEIQVWDNTNLMQLKLVRGINVSGTVTGLACSTNELYVVASSPNRLYVIKP
jgi:Tfp pilus assembly protein PilV